MKKAVGKERNRNQNSDQNSTQRKNVEFTIKRARKKNEYNTERTEMKKMPHTFWCYSWKAFCRIYTINECCWSRVFFLLLFSWISGSGNAFSCIALNEYIWFEVTTTRTHIFHVGPFQFRSQLVCYAQQKSVNTVLIYCRSIHRAFKSL